MNQTNRPIRKFNPGMFQSDEEVIEQFVVRKRELEIVLEVLRGNINSASSQHVLVVSPRGRGKTMLLARVAAEVNTNDEFSDCFLPVRFMEESHEIFNLADFWLDTLFYLARESAKHDPLLAEELRKTHADLTDHWHEKALAGRAHAAVLEAADRLGKKLVLTVENLQALCTNVDKDFGWKLRGALQSEPEIMLLATATSRFEGLDDADQPFFELFRIVTLEPLSTEECRRLWQVVSGGTVSRREIRPLEILTGGSPRLLVIIAEFAEHRSLRQLMEELVTLVDDHTEYFRGHLEVLAKGERRVYLAVIDLWQPSSTGEIAARARMDVRNVSALLGRLSTRGAVIVERRGKKRLYAAAERLYSIYYKLRRERDEAAVVANLIHFMMAFYRIGELHQMSGRLTSEAAESKVIREGIERALAMRPHVEDMPSRMAWSAIERISDNSAANAQAKAELHLEEDINTPIEEKNFRRVIEIVDRFVASGDLENFNAVIGVCNQMVKRFGGPRNLSLLAWMAQVLVLRARAQNKLYDFQTATPTCDEVVEQVGTFDGKEFQQLVAAALMGKGSALEGLGDFKAAILAYDEVIERLRDNNAPEIQMLIAIASIDKIQAQLELGDCKAAILICDEVVGRFGTSDNPEIQKRVATAWINKGIAQSQLGDLEAATAAFDKVVDRFDAYGEPELRERVATALINKGIARGLLDDIQGEISAYDKIIDRYGGQVEIAIALSFKSTRQAETGRAEEALQTCEELDRRLGTLPAEDWKTWLEWRTVCARALALMVQQKCGAAMDAFRSAYALFPPNMEMTMHEMQRIVPELIVSGASERDLVEILLGDRDKSGTLVPLIVALRQRSGEEVRAPAEVLEVAADIRERIEVRVAKVAPSAS